MFTNNNETILYLKFIKIWPRKDNLLFAETVYTAAQQQTIIMMLDGVKVRSIQNFLAGKFKSASKSVL